MDRNAPSQQIDIDGWDVPLVIDLEARPLSDLRPQLDPAQPSRFRIALPRVGSGQVIASFDIDSFLRAALADSLIAAPRWREISPRFVG